MYTRNYSSEPQNARNAANGEKRKREELQSEYGGVSTLPKREHESSPSEIQHSENPNEDAAISDTIHEDLISSAPCNGACGPSAEADGGFGARGIPHRQPIRRRKLPRHRKCPGCCEPEDTHPSDIKEIETGDICRVEYAPAHISEPADCSEPNSADSLHPFKELQQRKKSTLFGGLSQEELLLGGLLLLLLNEHTGDGILLMIGLLFICK